MNYVEKDFNNPTSLRPIQTKAVYDFVRGLFPLTTSSTTLYIQDYGQASNSGERGNRLKPYKSLVEAHSFANTGDVLEVFAGGDATDAFGRKTYSQTTIITKDVVVVCHPGVIFSGIVNIGNFSSSAPFTISWYGGTFTNALAVLRQKTGASTATIYSPRFEKAGYFQCSGGGTFGTYADTIEVFNLIARNDGSSPSITLTGRTDQSQAQNLYLKDCDIQNASNFPINIGASDGSIDGRITKVYLRGSTDLRRGDGNTTLVNVTAGPPSTTPLTYEQVIVDERAKGGSTYIPETKWSSFTNGVVDTTARTFIADAPPFFRTAEVEYTLNGGLTSSTAVDSQRTGDMFKVKVSAAKAIGQVGLRIRKGSGKDAGDWTFNDTAYPTPPQEYLFNGDFSVPFTGNADTGWAQTGGWTLIGGGAHGDNPGFLYQNSQTLDLTKQYKITVEWNNLSPGGSFSILMNSNSVNSSVTEDGSNTMGTLEIVFTPLDVHEGLNIKGYGNTKVDITRVSFIEVIP